MTGTGRWPKLLALVAALAITGLTGALTIPDQVPKMPALGDRAVNVAPAIQISLAGRKTEKPATELKPEPVNQAVPAPQAPPAPKPEPERTELPEPEPEALPEPAPEPEPTPPAPDAEPMAATPDQAPSQRSESDIPQSAVPLQQAGQSAQVDNYLSKLSRHLARYYEYPRRARRLGQEGTPVILFEFRRDGTLVAHSLRDSSGHSLLDDAALTMLARAAPLPAVPASMQGPSFTYALPVRFRLR